MLEIIAHALYIRFRYQVKTLYYMPAGPQKTPLLRDICILGMLRMFFRLIFHFRAAGLSDFVETQSTWLRQLARWVYHCPQAAIQLSALNPADGKYFEAKQIYILPNGLEDEGETRLPSKGKHSSATSTVHILFVGMLTESKGIMILLEAIRLLKDESIALHMVGAFTSAAFEKQAKSYCKAHGLEEIVRWEGVLYGDQKWQQYLLADIFCFPSFYESESFGNVVVEAMMFELPVVASAWRGVPGIVSDGNTGYLVAPKDAAATADRLRLFVKDATLREKMGQAGRQHYLEKYRLESFLKNIHQILLTESLP